MRHIGSRQNPLVARFRALVRGSEQGLMLLDGLHLVGDAAAAGLSVRHVMVAGSAAERRDTQAIVERLKAGGADIASASAPVMAAVSPGRSPSVMVAIAERPLSLDDRLFAGPSPLVLIACDVQDPGNVGAIARAAEAGGASGMIAAGECADPFGWKALRGSMGSALRLPIAVRASADEAVADARRHRCRIVAAVPRDGRSVFETDLCGPVAIVVGSEGRGLAASVVDHADQQVTIPMEAPVESLNTAIAAALLVYEARRQRLGAARP